MKNPQPLKVLARHGKSFYWASFFLGSTLANRAARLYEFCRFVDDLADSILFCIQNKLTKSLYNVGTGTDLTIKDLALLIQKITGHTGQIIWDSSKPDGTPRKLMNVDLMKKEGWSFKTGLSEGIEKTYQWFLENEKSLKKIKIKN